MIADEGNGCFHDKKQKTKNMSTVTSTVSSVKPSTKPAVKPVAKPVVKPVAKPAVKPDVKRKYTARGTTVVARRVTLFDGKVIGRGKPANATKSSRTVVYVPIGQKYNPTIHGLGVNFTSDLTEFSQLFKRISIVDLGQVYNLTTDVVTEKAYEKVVVSADVEAVA